MEVPQEGFYVSEQIIIKDTQKRPQLSIKTSSLIFYIDDPQEFFFVRTKL